MSRPSVSDPLADVLRAAIAQALATVHVSLPAIVQSYDRTTQKVTVQVPIRSRYIDDDGALQSEIVPAIPNVPVGFPSGTTWSFTGELVPGDVGRLLFAERSTDEWRAVGNADITAQDMRRFDLSDAVFLPGAPPFSSPLPSAAVSATGAVVRGPLVYLGDSTAVDFVALAGLVLAQLQAVKIAFDAHIHSGGTIGGFTGIPSALMPAPSSPAATKVKAL